MKKVYANSSIYITSNLINAIIPFVLLPVLTRILTKEQFGELSIFLTFYLIILSLISSPLNSFLSVKYFEVSNKTDIKSYSYSCIELISYSYLVLLFFIVFFSDSLSQLIKVRAEYIYLALFLSLINSFLRMKMLFFRLKEKAISYLLFNSGQVVISGVLTLIFLFSYSEKLDARFDALTVTSLLFFFITLKVTIKSSQIIEALKAKKHRSEILKFSLPLIPHLVGGFAINSIDKIMLSNILSLEIVAVYAVAFQMSNIIGLLFDALNKAFQPYFLKKLSLKNRDENICIAKLIYKWFALLLFIYLVSYLVSDYAIIFIAGEEYRSAIELFDLIFLGMIFKGMYLSLTYFYFHEKRTGLMSSISMFVGGVNVLLLYVLIQKYGVNGAALSFLFTMIFRFLLTFYFAKSKLNFPWLLK